MSHVELVSCEFVLGTILRPGDSHRGGRDPSLLEVLDVAFVRLRGALGHHGKEDEEKETDKSA